MPLTLDATVGGPASNAYLDETAAQAFMDATPNASAWTAAASPGRQLALVAATRMLDVLRFQGVKIDQAQALTWPRTWCPDPDYGANAQAWAGWLVRAEAYLDPTTIPLRIRRACAALALEVLRAGGSDVWGQDASLDVKREKIGAIETEYQDLGRRQVGLRAYPSVWREVAPLLEAANQPRAFRA